MFLLPLLHLIVYIIVCTANSITPQQCILTNANPHHCDIHARKLDEYHRSTLHAAIFRGNIQLIKAILNQTPYSKQDEHIRGSTLLIAACEKERLRTLFTELAKTFLRFGKWPKPKHKPSTESSHHHASPLLYESLIQLSKTNQVWPIDSNEIRLVSDISNHVKKSVLELPKLLLKHGIQTNEIDRRGRTALFEAVESFSLPLVQLLLSHGSNASHVDLKGITPLKLAEYNGLKDIRELLIQYGAHSTIMQDKDKKDNDKELVSLSSATTTQIPSTIEEIVSMYGNRCDFNVLKQPSWKSFRTKYVFMQPRPALIRYGFRTTGRKKKKKKKKKWTLPKEWTRTSLIKSKLSKIFVMVGSLPYGQITAPTLYQTQLPLRRFLKKHMMKTDSFLKNKSIAHVITSMNDKLNDTNIETIDSIDNDKEEQEEQEEISHAYVFDPNFFKTSGSRSLLTSLRKRRVYADQDPLFQNSIAVTQLVIGPIGSGAPAHFHESSFSTQIKGDKLWAMWPPGESMYTNIPSRKWWKKLFNNDKNTFPPLLCVQKPGDVVFVPPSWSHFTLVLSKEGSYSVADSISGSVAGYLSPLK